LKYAYLSVDDAPIPSSQELDEPVDRPELRIKSSVCARVSKEKEETHRMNRVTIENASAESIILRRAVNTPRWLESKRTGRSRQYRWTVSTAKMENTTMTAA
jgi:hypothetical protein